MPSLDAILPAVLFAALIAVLLAFTLGTQRNISRGNAILRWLQGGLPRIGQRTTLNWLGSSVVQLHVAAPVEPFREVTVMAVMEPRDVPILWFLTRARGRRDVLIFRASLRRAPHDELDAADPAAWIRASEPAEEDGWVRIDWPGDALAHGRGHPDPATVQAARTAWTRLAAASGGVWRVSVRQTVPHLEVHVLPPDLRAIGSEPLIEAIRGLAAEVA
ncbi:MAG: hypothetical protein ACRDGH_00385 [Candidatus Limnocylindria bacterium]